MFAKGYRGSSACAIGARGQGGEGGLPQSCCKGVLFWYSAGPHDGWMPEPRQITTANRRRSGAVRAIAADQEGVVGRAQLLARGVSSSAVDRALRSGRLHRLHPGVYSVPAPELLTEDALLIAALLAAGRGTMLTHGTAAWRWKIIAAPPARIELSVPHRRSTLDGVALFRPRVLRPGDTTVNGRFPTTSVARTVLDLAVRYEQRALLRVLGEAEFHHDLRPEDILRTLRRGHPGSANLRAALAAHAPGHGKVKSDLERRFRRLLVTRGIELPIRNHAIGPWEVDCVWPDRRVAVELDGRQHQRPHQADRDDDRDLWLRRHRWLPRRYGDHQLKQQPDAVIEDLHAAFKEAQALALTQTPSPSMPGNAP
jgi:very-short-patch-repair endonuclease